jgi:hypothetical protein
MPNPKSIGENAAYDRLVSAFAARSWHDDGDAARAVIAAGLAGSTDIASLAAALPGPFLVNNGISRDEAAGAIATALRGALVIVPAGQPGMHVTNIKVTNTVRNSGNFAGTVGGGTVSQVRQAQQVVGDEAARALISQYASNPAVREIIGSSTPVKEKRGQLRALLTAAGSKGLDVGEDVLAKVITGLLKGG